MKAVVLAAGKGERLGNNHPKPLTKLFGRPLIDHVLEGLKREGITDVSVVYRHRTVKEYLKDRVNLVFNDNVELGGGYSLLKGAEAIGDEPFVLLMSDHIFDSRILSKLLGSVQNGTTLCVDSDLHSNDLDEATKVLAKKMRIQEIGKDIKQYTALDTGIFFCNNDVLETAQEFDGSFSVSDVMKKLVLNEKLFTCDVTGHFWKDIDTPEDLRNAEREIAKTLIKPTDGLISKYLNRKISIPISKMLIKTPITPNQISFLSFFLGVFSGLLFAFGQTIFGGIMAQMSSIIDGCDGEIARIKGMGSNFGAFLDSLLDRYADVAIILGMVALDPSRLWLIGGLAILGSYSISYSSSRAEYYTGKRFTSGIESLMTRDMRLFLIMLGGLFNQIFGVLVVLAVLTNIILMVRISSFKGLEKEG